MAKAARQKIKLESTAGTGYFYVTTKPTRSKPIQRGQSSLQPGAAAKFTSTHQTPTSRPVTA